MNTTYLNAFHHAEGGNMVDFAGWEMPINYGSQINEHNLVRQQVGVFDVLDTPTKTTSALFMSKMPWPSSWLIA